ARMAAVEAVEYAEVEILVQSKIAVDVRRDLDGNTGIPDQELADPGGEPTGCKIAANQKPYLRAEPRAACNPLGGDLDQQKGLLQAHEQIAPVRRHADGIAGPG